jgi:hypothetical protein
MRVSCGHTDRYEDGHCRPCTLARRKRTRKPRAKYAWKKTLRGRVAAMMHGMRKRSKQKGFPAPTVDSVWLYEKLRTGVCELSGLPFATWSKETTAFIPSIDRIDPARGYTPDNCRMVVWALNAAFADWGEETFRLVARAWLARRPGCDLV